MLLLPLFELQARASLNYHHVTIPLKHTLTTPSRPCNLSADIAHVPEPLQY